MFDSITKALSYIKEALTSWSSIGSTLNSRLYEINTLLRSYSGVPSSSTPQSQEAIGKLIVLKSQTEQSLRDYNDFLNKLGPFKSYFSDNTVGVFPIFIITGGVALASALYIYLEKVKNEGAALELIKKGLLKPSEASSLLTGGGLSETLGNASTLLMIGAGVYMLFLFGPMLKKGTS